MGMVIDRSHVPSLAVPDTKTMDPKPWLCPVGSWLITIVGALTLVASVILAETLTVAAPAAIFTVVGVTVELTKTGALTSASAPVTVIVVSVLKDPELPMESANG